MSKQEIQEDINPTKTLNDKITLTKTSIYKGKPPPIGSVYFCCELKHEKVTYTQQQLVRRSGMPVEVENAIADKFKANFLQEVIKAINNPKKK